jgi:hypothetical protein
MNVSVASGCRPHPGLPTKDLFKLFRAAIKDHDETGDLVIQSTYEEIVRYDHERARCVMELVVRRHPLAWNVLYALLAEARLARPSVTRLRSEENEAQDSAQ